MSLLTAVSGNYAEFKNVSSGILSAASVHLEAGTATLDTLDAATANISELSTDTLDGTTANMVEINADDIYTANVNCTGVLTAQTVQVQGNLGVTGNYLSSSGDINVHSLVTQSVMQSNSISFLYGPTVYFPNLSTTASAANAYLDSGNANQLRRSTSSAQYKDDVQTLTADVSNRVLQLRPVRYRSKCEGDRQDWSYYGLIAEEVAEVDPRLVQYGYPDEAYDVVTEGGFQKRVLKPDQHVVPNGVAYERLPVLLLDVVRRQQEAIEALQAEVALLKTK